MMTEISFLLNFLQPGEKRLINRGLEPLKRERLPVADLTDAFEEMRRQVRQRQEHLDHLAHHDMLTGLPNRLLFRDRLEHALALSRRSGTMNAVMFLDLDGFKKINDTLGHAAGDALLRAAADRLSATMRTSDTIARLGGDEFAILIERVEHRHDVTRLCEKILAALETPFDLDGRRLHISTSIGIAPRWLNCWRWAPSMTMPWLDCLGMDWRCRG